MKKIALGLFAIGCVCTASAQTQAQPDSAAKTKTKNTYVNVTASFKNQHYWRGYAVAPSPLIASMISVGSKKSGIEFGTWNGFGLDGGFKDADLYVQWSKKGFTVALWDIFNYSNYSVSPADAGYGDHSQADYFDYDAATTRHFFDLSVGYDVPKTKLSLFFATIIAGRDRNVSVDGSNRYSSYAKASYSFTSQENVTITPYVSYGFAFNSKDGGTFWQWTSNAKSTSDFNEIGVNFSRPVKITEKYSITAFAGVVGSPVNKTISGLFGVTFF